MLQVELPGLGLAPTVLVKSLKTKLGAVRKSFPDVDKYVYSARVYIIKIQVVSVPFSLKIVSRVQ